MTTKIPYVDETWNVTVDCTRVSPGCDNCWALKLASTRLRHHWLYRGLTCQGDWTGEIRLADKKILEQPLHWKQPRRILVNATSDLFHKNVPTSYLKEVFAIVQQCPQHTFLGLTKRPGRAVGLARYTKNLENWWPGVSIENQEMMWRLNKLCWIPAAHRWISIEPLLGPIVLPSYIYIFINWIVIGCESGSNRRPCNLEWIRDLIKDCSLNRIPVYVKQVNINGKVSHNPAEWPEWARKSEWPAKTAVRQSYSKVQNERIGI